MTAKKSNRGSDPTSLTIHMLCARAAGRCQFEGCNEYLFQDSLTLREFNKSNIAHIVASSPDGPRGDPIRSHELSPNIENLMLMCPTHHKMIDDDPDKFTEETLLAMKNKQEAAVRNACELMYREPSNIVRFMSPIKGNKTVDISYNQAVDAIHSTKKPADFHGITIEIKSIKPYKTQDFWTDVDEQLYYKVKHDIQNIINFSPETHFSVFPIAPIPLIIKFGYLLGDKIGTDIYQKTRTPDTWSWQESEATNKYKVTRNVINEKASKAAIILSLTADISEDRCLQVYNPDVTYSITAEKTGVDSVKSLKDLSAFWHKYQMVCDEIRNCYTDVGEIGLFPAIPVSAAFEVGRRYMPGAYPKMKIFDECEGFFETLSIGGKEK